MKKAFEDYLEVIYILEQRGKPIHSIEVSKLLAVSRSAVNQALNELIVSELVIKPSYGEITLTPKGREIAIRTYSRHNAIKNFLISIGVSIEIAEIDACKIEHIISEETLLAIKKSIH